MSLAPRTIQRLRSFLGPTAAADLESGLGGGKVELFKLDDLLSGFQPNWRCPSNDEAEGYENSPLCWTDGRVVHFRGDLIHVGNVGADTDVAGWAAGKTPALHGQGDRFSAVDQASDSVNHFYWSGCEARVTVLHFTFDWFLTSDMSANRVLTAGSDGLSYLTVMGSYLLASAVA